MIAPTINHINTNGIVKSPMVKEKNTTDSITLVTGSKTLLIASSIPFCENKNKGVHVKLRNTASNFFIIQIMLIIVVSQTKIPVNDRDPIRFMIYVKN